MAKLRCRLCGGKLVNNRCTFCGLDNSCYDRDRTYQKTFSDQRRVERSAERGTPAQPVQQPVQPQPVQKQPVQKQPVRQGSVRPAMPAKTAADPRSVYRKTGAPAPKKSGWIAWITILIIILCAFISFLSSGGFTLPDSFGSITSDGTYSDPSGESIDWDPYTGVTRDIPADGETYETVLGTGAYKTGIHLPEGVYRAELLAGSGSVSISDRENSIYIHNYFGTEEEYDEIAEMDDLRLYNGADLDVGEGVLVRLTTDNAQPLTAEPYPAGSTDTYSLPEGEYRAGTGASEIPEGIYDISIAEDESDPFGYASITLLYPNGLSGYYWADSPALATDAEGYTSAGVKNVVIPDGTEISVTYGDIVLTPGQACYDVDYTDYPQQ